MMEKRAKIKIDIDKPIRKPIEPLPPWFESGRGTGFITKRKSKPLPWKSGMGKENEQESGVTRHKPARKKSLSRGAPTT